MLRVCPYGDLPSAAWTALPLGLRDTESPPGWISPKAAPQMTSCRQKQTGASTFSARLSVFSHSTESEMEKWRHVILTHHFGVCISGQTEPQEPSTWLVNDPTEKICMLWLSTVLRVVSWARCLTNDNKHSHWWSSYSNQCDGYLLPSRSRLFSSRCPLLPKHCEQQDLCGCTAQIKTDITKTEPKSSESVFWRQSLKHWEYFLFKVIYIFIERCFSTWFCKFNVEGWEWLVILCGYLFGGQILHSSGHLVSTGHQVFDGHVLHGNLVWVVAVLHARWAPSSQVLPQVPLGCILYYHIQRT